MPPFLYTRAKKAMIAAILLAAVVLALLPTAAHAAGTQTSATQIDAYLGAKGSPMAGQGAAFITSGAAWKVDPRLLVAISGAESSFGRITCGPFNGWGYGCPNHPYEFSSWADAIDTVAEGLRTNYLAEGRTTVATIGQKYAPVGASNDPTNLNSAWVINVSRFLIEQGGDPNDCDLDGIAGSLPLGLETIALSDQYQYQVADSEDATAATSEKELTATTDNPAKFTLKVKNSGTADWTRATVRLRRVDQSERVTSAPFASLSVDTVKAGSAAVFTVDLSTAGLQSASASTEWRIEGPGGEFGNHIIRPVRVIVSPFVIGKAEIEAPASLAVGQTSAVIVRLQNLGSADWVREGDERVLLGIQKTSGPSLYVHGWQSPTVAAALLQRRVAPGEWASFAFPIKMGAVGTGSATLELRPFRGETLSVGPVVLVSVETRG